MAAQYPDPRYYHPKLATKSLREWELARRKKKGNQKHKRRKRERKLRRRRSQGSHTSRSPAAHYQNYLNSDHWKARREKKLDAAGRVCELCGSTRHIQVHHKTYKRLWREKDEDLQVVCRWCHMEIHGLAAVAELREAERELDQLAQDAT